MDGFEAYFLQGFTDGIKKEAEAPKTPVMEIIKKAMKGPEGKAKAEGSLLKTLLAAKKSK